MSERDIIINAARSGAITPARAAEKLGLTRQRVHQILRGHRGQRLRPLAPHEEGPVSAQVAWRMCREVERERHKPHLLLSLLEGRSDDAMRLMFEGLRLHYLEAVTAGRLDLWAKAAHAAVDLLACVPEAKITKRADLP